MVDEKNKNIVIVFDTDIMVLGISSVLKADFPGLKIVAVHNEEDFRSALKSHIDDTCAILMGQRRESPPPPLEGAKFRGVSQRLATTIIDDIREDNYEVSGAKTTPVAILYDTPYRREKPRMNQDDYAVLIDMGAMDENRLKGIEELRSFIRQHYSSSEITKNQGNPPTPPRRLP